MLIPAALNDIFKSKYLLRFLPISLFIWHFSKFVLPDVQRIFHALVSKGIFLPNITSLSWVQISFLYLHRDSSLSCSFSAGYSSIKLFNSK